MRPAALVPFAALTLLAACSNPYTHEPTPVTPTPSPAGSAAPTATPAAPAPTPPSGPPALPVPAAAPAAPAAPAARAPADSTRTGQEAVDLAGDWSWSADLGGSPVNGTLLLTRSGTTYGGQATPDGDTPAPVRSVTITGSKVLIRVDAPAGEAVCDLTLSPDRKTMSGTLAYNGSMGSFTATKR